jgi:propionyl-CoA synthetase
LAALVGTFAAKQHRNVTTRTYTYAGLLDEVARFAGVLRGLGVDKGDRVIIYLPMIPEAFRAIKKEDPEGKLLQEYDLSGFKILFLAGERLDPETYRWAGQLLRVPVVDHWWQTETGWAIAADPMGLEPMPTKPGSPTVPMPGYDVRILDVDGTELKAGQTGEIVVRLPLPPGCLPTLWGDDERFVSSYLAQHPGFYTTGDGGYRDADGYLYVMGRVDDVINVAGHRLSTG